LINDETVGAFMSFIVGAYASAPAGPAAAEYAAQVAALDGVRGLEVPVTGEPNQPITAGLAEHTDLVLTAMVATVQRNAVEPDFGLASPDAEGRAAALGLVLAVAELVRRANDRAGRRVVNAVELQAAPSGRGSADALAASLDAVACGDWDGALLTLEHCDAVGTGRPHQKGYLPLEQEIDVVARFDGAVAITINWGRSAIEGRAAETAADHIALAREAKILGGLMFSGVAAQAGPYGDAWADAHLPPSFGADSRLDDLTASEPTSLLGPGEMTRALQAAGGAQQFTGLKIGVRPADLSASDRLAYVRDAVRMLARLADRAAVTASS
jgi:hypothetical protein